MNKENVDTKSEISLWQIVILILCVYVIIALLINTIFDLPEDISSLLIIIDNLICIVFIGDFVYRILTVDNKKKYLKWGWIDLISSIPNLQILRWARFVRIVRIFRLLRGVRSTKLILKFIFANRAKGALFSVTMISFLLMIFSTIAILNVEVSPESNINTPSDALWWSFVTITTVGYGDYYPTTLLGRIIAGVLMTAGVGLFGTLTAYVASYFVREDEHLDENSELQLIEKLDSIEKQLKDIREKIRD